MFVDDVTLTKQLPLVINDGIFLSIVELTLAEFENFVSAVGDKCFVISLHKEKTPSGRRAIVWLPQVSSSFVVWKPDFLF